MKQLKLSNPSVSDCQEKLKSGKWYLTEASTKRRVLLPEVAKKYVLYNYEGQACVMDQDNEDSATFCSDLFDQLFEKKGTKKNEPDKGTEKNEKEKKKEEKKNKKTADDDEREKKEKKRGREDSSRKTKASSSKRKKSASSSSESNAKEGDHHHADELPVKRRAKGKTSAADVAVSPRRIARRPVLLKGMTGIQGGVETNSMMSKLSLFN